MSEGNVEIVIDSLVLHGFQPGQRDAIANSLRTELAARLAGWAPQSSGEVTHLDGGAFTVSAAAPPHVVGRQVAGRVSHALTEQTGSGPTGGAR
jgi:hypothetical protein